MSFSVEAFRSQFPILDQTVNDAPLVYLDNAATTQKPIAVLDTLSDYYHRDNSNVHRGAHELADRATRAFEQSREKLAAFIGAESKEVIWTRGTTEAINLIAHAWGMAHLGPGDKVIVTRLEHHSNIVPWQLLSGRLGFSLEVIDVTPEGELDMAQAQTLFDEDVKLLSVVHVCNAIGTVNPLAQLHDMARAVGAKILVDGAQALSHMHIDVKALDCDFYCGSAHKLYGPTGVGFAYGKYQVLETMVPYQGGGEMIETVSFEGSTFQSPPLRFEAGTPDISGVIAFGAAIDFLSAQDRDGLMAHEKDVLDYAQARASDFSGLRIIGQAPHKEGVLSFLLDGTHPHDVGTLLDQQGVAVRTGHHCCQPLMARLGIPGTVRASFAAYNTREEVDRLFSALEKAKQFL